MIFDTDFFSTALLSCKKKKGKRNERIKKKKKEEDVELKSNDDAHLNFLFYNCLKKKEENVVFITINRNY